jgi:hypothetical protein
MSITIHIGYSKAASTWLQEILLRTESINYVHKPPLWVNINGKVKWNESKLNNIIGKLESNKPIVISNEHLLLPGIHPEIGCSITNINYVKELIEYLKSVIKNPKILVITRHQDEMISSRYLQFLLQGGSLNINKFLSLLIPNKDVSIYADYRYKIILNTLKEAFGNNSLLTLDTIDIKNNPDNVIEKISRFIGANIDINQPIVHKKANVGLSNYGAKVIRIWNKLFVIEKENQNSKTRTRIPYMIWLSFIVIIKKVDNLIWYKIKRPSVLNKDQMSYIKTLYAENK